MSYFWGVIWYFYSIQSSEASSAAWKLGDCDPANLIAGAVKYNGGGDPNYETKTRSRQHLDCLAALQVLSFKSSGGIVMSRHRRRELKFVWVVFAIYLWLGNHSKLKLTASENDSAEALNDKIAAVDPTVVKKIRPLYPDVTEHRQLGHPTFICVEEVARATRANGLSCSVVKVLTAIPSGAADHGGGDLLIFTNSRDSTPTYRRSLHSLPFIDQKIELVNDRWFRFGKTGALISLIDDNSLKHFAECGNEGLLNKFCHMACRRALIEYLRDGREKFLEGIPVKTSPEREFTELPNRIESAVIYHSLVEDFRSSGFKYTTAWEGTIFAQVVPENNSKNPIVIEFGVTGEYEGIDDDDVKIFIWRTLVKEPLDRPISDWQWRSNSHPIR